MNRLYYEVPTVWIVLAIFVGMIIAIECGYRVGLRRQPHISESARNQISAMQAMLFAVIGLLLGFTFSQSLARFDSRAAAVVDEANAIGTAWLRSGLLEEPFRGEAEALYTQYSAYRADEGAVTLADGQTLDQRFAEAGRMQMAIWDIGARAIAADSTGGAARLQEQAEN
ncbi:MAG: hypothetical protein ACK5MQ_05395 [Pikeienuella sp.]